MKPQIYIAVEDGWKCKPPNPFVKFGNQDQHQPCADWLEFERNNPTLDLTEKVKVGERFEGEEVYQWKKDNGVWETENWADNVVSSECEFPTRIAIKPLQSKPLREDKESDLLDRIYNPDFSDPVSSPTEPPTEDVGKVETVDQAAEKSYPQKSPTDRGPAMNHAFANENIRLRQAFTIGANWQKEQLKTLLENHIATTRIEVLNSNDDMEEMFITELRVYTDLLNSLT